MTVYLINMYDFHVNPIVLDIRALSFSCRVQCWSGLRRGVTTCMSVDCDKEDCEEAIYSDVQAVHGSSEDPGCLLDAICGAPTCAELSSDFVLLWKALQGACCCQIQTGEVYAPVWLHPVHSCTPCPFMGVIWWHGRYVDALLRPSGGSRWSMCCVRSVCAWLHRLVLRHIASIHDCTTDESSSRCICDAAQSYPSWGSTDIDTCGSWCKRAQTCSGKCYYLVRCMPFTSIILILICIICLFFI